METLAPSAWNAQWRSINSLTLALCTRSGPGSKAYLVRRWQAEMMGRINQKAYFHRNERHTPASHVCGVLPRILSDKRNVERVEQEKIAGNSTHLDATVDLQRNGMAWNGRNDRPCAPLFHADRSRNETQCSSLEIFWGEKTRFGDFSRVTQGKGGKSRAFHQWRGRAMSSAASDVSSHVRCRYPCGIGALLQE
jgi:hypothetical protein